jgi:hypothetical protein
MFLTYTFVSTPIVSRGRSTPHFPPRQLSPAGRIVARHPFPVPLPALPTAYLPLTPLRGFSSPRDQSAGPIRRREAYPDDSPDCLSLPACCMIEPAARGSTFQTRYVSPDLLFRRYETAARRSDQLLGFSPKSTDRRLVSTDQLQLPRPTNKAFNPIRRSSAGVQDHINCILMSPGSLPQAGSPPASR